MYSIRKHSFLALACTACLVLLCGCPGKKNSGSGTKKIAIITPTLTNWFNEQLLEGAKKKAEEVGYQVISYAPAGDSTDADLVALAQKALAESPDAISVCGMAPASLQTVAKKALAAGVPMFVHNQSVATCEGVEAYIGFDEYNAGRDTGTYALDYLKRHREKGAPIPQVAVLDGGSGEHSRLRASGFCDVMRFSADVQIVEEKNANWSEVEARKVTEALLSRYPNLKMVFACSDSMAFGASKAAFSASRDIACIGFGGSQKALYDVKGREICATLATSPERMGLRLISTIMDSLSNSGLITPGTVIKTETTVVRDDNIDSFMGGFADLKPQLYQSDGKDEKK